jgi:hypothetical protein
MFSQIHEIVFHGKGGYDWDTVYNMPIWLRRFTFEKLKEFYEKEKEEAEKQQNLLKTNNSKDIAHPNIVSPNNKSKQPTYTYNSKVPKK